MKPLLFALLPAVAFAASPPATLRASVLLIPLDRGAEANTVKLEAWMQNALAEFPGTRVKKTEDLFGMPEDAEAVASLERAEKGFAESSRAFLAHDAENAGRKLRATIKEYQRAAGAMKDCRRFCDALAMYASLLLERGQTDEARRMVLDLLALDPTYEVDAKKLGRALVMLKSTVATSRGALLRGDAHVASRPSGARVFVNGELKGYTPITLNTLPVGKHLVRVERPGFERFGQFIEVTPDDVVVQAELEPTSAWQAWDGVMDKVAQEANDGGGSALTSLGKSLALDRALIGTLKAVDGGTEVAIGLFDLRTGKRVAAKRVVYTGDEYGQLQSEVAHLVNGLLNGAGAPKQRRGGDPLENRSGLEDWSAEDRGGKGAQKTKTSDGDPLEGVSGMEDW